MRLLSMTSAFVLGGALAGAALASAPRLERSLAVRPGVVVDGRWLPADTAVRPWLEGIAARVSAREAYVSLPESLEQTTFAELGIELDVDTTLASVTRALPVLTFRDRVRALFGREPEPPAVELAFRLESAKSRAFLEQLAPHAHRPPVNARLDLVRHERIEDRPGRDLDVGATLAAIESGERRDLALFTAEFVPIEPAVTVEALTEVDVTRVLSSYETDFSKKPRSRIPNIALAARYLNGSVVGPGEVLSFNRIVGPRTYERGFHWAPVIVADELEQGLGGGVCQVASTFFAAAALGGFEIVERRSHSRPSGYAPLGLDAAVIYPEVDLRLRNPHASPVIIHAFLPDPKTLRVELLGREPPGKVEHFFGVDESEPFGRRVVVKPDLPAGKIDRRQKGNKGYDGRSVIRTTLADGTQTSRTYRSKYYPVPEVYWVAADVKPDQLPPLPEGAVAVELVEPGSALDGERGDQPEP
ncbi:MAG TPA: VanW family protein [Polyangiaceae bacterium]